MFFTALFLVAITTIADFIGAGIVVRGLYRPQIARLIINFAIGTLLALSVTDLLPEALAEGKAEFIFSSFLAGIVFAFLFERLVAWYHCHDEKCDVHPFSPGKKITLLAGSALEEFIDGAAIGLAVVAGATHPTLAISMTLAVFAHELPETASKVIALASFGESKGRAMRLILTTAIAGFIGAGAAVLFVSALSFVLPILLAFVAGIFLYIATADLIPELHHTVLRKLLVWEIAAMLLGILIVMLLGNIEPR